MKSNDQDFPDGRDPHILPLSITMPNWPAYIEYCQKHLGDSPTRGIDKMGMNMKDPQAFLATLDLCNRAEHTLAHPTIHWDFVHLSFMCTVRKGMALDLTRLPIQVMYSPYGDGDTILVLCASMRGWLDCYRYDNWSPRLTQFLFLMFTIFKDMGLDCLTQKVTTYPRQDGYGFTVHS